MLVALDALGGGRTAVNASCSEVLPYSHLYKRINISVLTAAPDCSTIVQGQRGTQKEG